MVNFDYEQYRKEALDYARAEMDQRGLKIEPVSFTDNTTVEAEGERSDSEYIEPPAGEIVQEASDVSGVEFKIFSGEWSSWEQLFSEAAEFATEIGPLNLIGISHSARDNEGVVTVWYWA
jgi:hypothetical protein